MSVNGGQRVMKKPADLSPEKIHIFTGSFDLNRGASGRMKSFLSPAEKKRAEAFRFQNDQIRYVQAHVILRRILSRYSGVDPGSIEFEAGLYGKPYLKNEQGLHFNLSHTKDYFAVALSLRGDVGIDIEKQDDMNDMEDVAGQFMSDEEFGAMRKLSRDLRKPYFYECWVRKEALLKAAGIGLGADLRRISVLKDMTGIKEKHITGCLEGKQNIWWLDTFDLDDNHIGAVCIATTPIPSDYSIRFQTVDLSDSL